jgi:hypothetical protein
VFDMISTFLGVSRPALSQSSLKIMSWVVAVWIMIVNFVTITSNLMRTNTFNHTTFHHISKLIYVFNWRPTKWAWVLSLRNPAHDTVCMEVMAFITLEYCYFVFRLIFTKADLTLGFCSEFIWVKWSSREILNNLWYLVVT